jgi:hypothetical protein
LCQAPLAKPKEIQAFPAAPSDSMSQNLAQRLEPSLFDSYWATLCRYYEDRKSIRGLAP